MNEYVIFTDSGSDIKPEVLKKWGVEYKNLTFRFDDSDREFTNEDMTISDFYTRMREGGIAKTSAINPEIFAEAFEKILSEGKDILYLGFSSGLSTTFNSARIAAGELLDKYPERKIITVDTLCASAGLGLAVYIACEKKNSGATIEENAEYLGEICPKISHWVTVDDLEYLKRGGRVSPTVAFVGKALGIKPIIHVTNEGKLDSVSKARGRKAAVTAIVDKYGETAEKAEGGFVFISHADASEDADMLVEMLRSRYGVSVEMITDIGPVIGAHAGPGTLALFYIAKER
ncbi:MAG: DegV family protein [Clostridia bacterium]|nr:DegV family protein [Clostridia bacterium]